MADPTPNLKDALDTLKFLHEPGAVFELCLIKPAQDKSPQWEGRAFGKKPTVAGWFKDQEKAARLAIQLQAEGIYVTLNPCVPAMLSKANERLKVCGEGDRTSDTAIAGYRNLLIDIDPQLETGRRPPGVSSSEIEHDRALGLERKIKTDLAQEGWLEPLYCDSGNGAHLDYPLELENNEDNKLLLKSVLAGLAAHYAEDLTAAHCELDQKVFNPARLTKLYGTWARKGDDTPDRPHRLSQVISIPDVRVPVPVELLTAMAAAVQGQSTLPKTEKTTATLTTNGKFDVGAYLTRYGVEVVKVKPHHDAVLYCLQVASSTLPMRAMSRR